MYDTDNKTTPVPLSARDYHVLMALERRHLHGYAIMKSVETDSNGAVTADIGSLYRVLARLMNEGLVVEVDPPPDAPTETRGRARRYYGVTGPGRVALHAETERMRRVLQLADERRRSSEAPA